jgi:hypothetical protein
VALIVRKVDGFSPADVGGGPFMWIEADFPTIVYDPGTLVVSAVPSAGSLPDTYTPPVANSPLRQVVQGRPAFNFNNVGTGRLSSGVASSNFRFLHDGTGCTIFGVARRNANAAAMILDTCNNVNTDVGIFLRKSTAPANSINLAIGNGGAAVVSVAPASWPASDNARIFSVTFDAVGYSLRSNNTVVSSGGLSAVPAGGDPEVTLQLGAFASGGQGLATGDLLAVILYTSVLATDEVTSVNNYLIKKWRGSV